MQTLQQELDPKQNGLGTNDHPVFREMMTDPAIAYAEEVRSLRQRVALLEAELAATKASNTTPARQAPPLTTIDFAPTRRAERHVSEFSESVMPAVMAVQPTAHASPAPASTMAPTDLADTDVAELAHTAATQPVPNPGFAQAWTAETAGSSFEERVAEKAFFQASTVDEESRSWLLEQ